jgi:hypothetical protein
MIIYLIVFVFSYFCSLIAKKVSRSHIFLFYFFSFLAILFPSFLAGFRDTTVGKDIEVYVIGTFHKAILSESLTDFIIFSGLRFEPLYLLYNYIISRFTDNIFWFFFIQQFFVLSLIYSFAFHFENKFSSSLFYLFYLLFFYNESLNLVRQTFSIAVIIYSFRFLFEKRIIRYNLCILIAYIFHYSSVCLFFLYPLYWWLVNINNKNSFRIVTVFILLLSLCLYIYFENIILYGISTGIINSFYLIYIDQIVSGFNITEKILVVFLWIISKIIDITRNGSMEKQNDIISVFSIVSMLFLFCGVYNIVSQRIALYFILIEFIILLKKIFNFNLTIRILFSSCLFLILIIRWLHYAHAIDAYSGTIPYKISTLQGII